MTELFKIFTVEATEANEISAAPDDPHHHDFEELIIGLEGQLEHFIDFKTTTIDAPLISFVTRGKVHRVIPRVKDGKCHMWVLRFKSEFIAETTFQLYAFYHDHATFPMEEGSCFNRFILLCEMIAGEMQRENPDLSVVRQLLSSLLIMIESERRKCAPDELNTSRTRNTTFQNFLRILEDNFHRPEGVEFYAEKLFMSARNLNNICHTILQKSVSEIIETRKLIEAKNLLISTDKTVAEIGYELGFNEKSYFSTVFKKRTDQTPREFREEMRKLLS